MPSSTPESDTSKNEKAGPILRRVEAPALSGVERLALTSVEGTRRWAQRYGQILLGLPLLAALILMASLAPVLVGHDPNAVNPRVKVQMPSRMYVLGTDEFGRDILSRLAYGARITLLVAIASVMPASAERAARIGVLLGAAEGSALACQLGLRAFLRKGSL